MYEVFCATVTVEDVGATRTFGIRSPSGRAVGDVTTDLMRLEGFVSALNQYDASELHLKDLVDDFLAA